MSTIHCCYQPISDLSSNIIDSMLDSSSYWNPDYKSKKNSEKNNCVLGKANLFNTSYSKSDHVFSHVKSGSIISANARIDNRFELIEKLNLKNKSISDGKLILEAYLKWDKKCVNHFQGDFAFIIWDEIKHKIFAARDHFGVKFLMYNHQEKGTMISNEPSAFFHSKWMKKQVKESWLARVIWGQLSSKVEAAYKGLEILPPAHFMEVNEKGVHTERYWKIPENTSLDKKPKEELIARFKGLFENAVKVRTETEFPLACQLSEGLDSNGITGFAAINTPNKDIYTFSYRSVELNDKTKSVWDKTYIDIQEILDMYPNLKPVWSDGTQSKNDHYKLTNHIAGAVDCSEQFMEHCHLAQQKNVKVLLSGWGGDHCVSSYGDFYESELFSTFKWRQLYQLLNDKQKRGRGGSSIKTFVRLILKHYFPQLSLKIILNKPGLESALLKRSNDSMLNKKYIEKYHLDQELNSFISRYQARYSTKDYSKRELFEIGVEKRLMDSELIARMYRLEYRFPMLDLKLVEYAYNLPSYLKVYKGVERYAFREIIKGITTERNRLRRKSDVNHPKIENRFTITDTEQQQLDLIMNSPLLKDYLKIIKSVKNPEYNFILKQFLKSINNLNYHIKSDNEVEINE